MKSGIYVLFLLCATLVLHAQTSTFHDYTVTSIDGQEYPLAQLKGKKVLVVNVASKCGLTPPV